MWDAAGRVLFFGCVEGRWASGLLGQLEHQVACITLHPQPCTLETQIYTVLEVLEVLEVNGNAK